MFYASTNVVCVRSSNEKRSWNKFSQPKEFFSIRVDSMKCFWRVSRRFRRRKRMRIEGFSDLSEKLSSLMNCIFVSAANCGEMRETFRLTSICLVRNQFFRLIGAWDPNPLFGFRSDLSTLLEGHSLIYSQVFSKFSLLFWVESLQNFLIRKSAENWQKIGDELLFRCEEYKW